MRSGTENVPGIAGIAKAAQIMYDNYDQDIEKLYDLKKCFIEGVKKIDRVIVNGPDCMDGAPHIVSVSFSGVRSEVLLHSLEDKGIYVSAGSACSAHKPQPSATLGDGRSEGSAVINDPLQFFRLYHHGRNQLYFRGFV